MIPLFRLPHALFLGFVLASSGCDIPVTFDKHSWTKREDPLFPPLLRDRMLDDLLKHHQLKGLHYRQLTDSLGAPDGGENGFVFYTIKEEYGHDIDPVYEKNLLIYIDKDSVVTGYEVKEEKQ